MSEWRPTEPHLGNIARGPCGAAQPRPRRRSGLLLQRPGVQLTARAGHGSPQGLGRAPRLFLFVDRGRAAGDGWFCLRTVDPADLDYYEKRLRQFGVKYDLIPEDYRRGWPPRTAMAAMTASTKLLEDLVRVRDSPPAGPSPQSLCGVVRSSGNIPDHDHATTSLLSSWTSA